MKKRKIQQTMRTRSVTYRLEWVYCGKRGCNTCPHGPYWYAYFYQRPSPRQKLEGKRGKAICKYIGRRFRLMDWDPGEPRRLGNGRVAHVDRPDL